MSWAIVPGAKKCPICGSWDTVLESPDITRSRLYCHCGSDTQRLVWSDELQDGGTTVERIHRAGSVEESTVKETTMNTENVQANCESAISDDWDELISKMDEDSTGKKKILVHWKDYVPLSSLEPGHQFTQEQSEFLDELMLDHIRDEGHEENWILTRNCMAVAG